MATAAINSGHALVNTAEEFEEKGEWAKAANAHRLAAAQFQQATNDTGDIETKNTLNLLINNHTRRSNELIRKIKRIEQQHQQEKKVRTLNQEAAAEEDSKMDDIQREIDEIQKDINYSSTKPIGESYALLSDNNEVSLAEDEEPDPFNKFWGIVETLVDKLPNPVAFTSAPIHEDDVLPTDVMVETKETDRIKREMSDISDSYFLVSQNNNNSDGNKWLDSKKENERLKMQVQKLKNQVQALEQKSAESSLLKSSIIQFRNDVHTQARRLRQTHEANMMTRSAITSGAIPNKKNMHILGSSTVDMVNRVRELEDENRNIKLQNKKQEVLINKYRERWERLKEGAKKRQPNNTTLLKSLASNVPPSVIPPATLIDKK